MTRGEGLWNVLELGLLLKDRPADPVTMQGTWERWRWAAAKWPGKQGTVAPGAQQVARSIPMHGDQSRFIPFPLEAQKWNGLSMFLTVHSSLLGFIPGTAGNVVEGEGFKVACAPTSRKPCPRPSATYTQHTRIQHTSVSRYLCLQGGTQTTGSQPIWSNKYIGRPHL